MVCSLFFLVPYLSPNLEFGIRILMHCDEKEWIDLQSLDKHNGIKFEKRNYCVLRIFVCINSKEMINS